MANYDGTTTLTNSLIASNDLLDCYSPFGPFGPSTGNVSSGSDCPATVGDPRLGPLASNGGPTKTIALGEGSAAIDVVPVDVCLAADQRGVPRPQRSACDAGAFELAPPAPGPGGSGSDSGGGADTRDTTPPVVRLRLTRQKLRKALRRGYICRFATNETGSAIVRLRARGRIVARGRRAIASSGRQALRARFTRRAKRELARRKRVRLTLVLDVRDAAGNATRKTARLKLRR